MNTIPESPETLEAQLAWLKAGKRKAVLVTPGAPLPALSVGDGFSVLLIDQGVLVFRLQDFTPAGILIEVHRGKLAEILGYGIGAKPQEASDVVTVRGQDGREKQAVATDPSHRAAVVAAAQRVKDPGDTVHLENGTKVIDDRLRCLDGRELKVRPYRAEADHLALAAAARADDHVPLNPTHVIEHDGEIVGYFGVNSLPLYRLWFHSEKIHAGASTRLLFMIENHFRMAGVGLVATVINEHSPFYPAAPRGGYLECLGDRLFLKQL
jgi:hypothetical protein